MLRSLVIGPKSLRSRIIRTSLASAGSLTIWTPLLGFGSLIHDGPPIVGWKVGVCLWIISILTIPLYYLVARRVRRAIGGYLLMLLGFMPAVLSFMDAGLRLSLRQLGPDSTLWILIGLLAGLAATPFAVSSRRKWFRDALERGHLKHSFDPESATWDPGYDYDQAGARMDKKNPGCLMRLLPWIGPGVGMALADIFGRSTALTILVFCLLAPGYGIFQMSLVAALTFLFEFHRLERELGSQILLVEED